MSSQTKSAGGFWAKTIFWLVIIVIAFIFIRSLAKHPGDESAATTGGATEEPAMATATSAVESQPASPAAESSVMERAEESANLQAETGDQASTAAMSASMTGGAESAPAPAAGETAAVQEAEPTGSGGEQAAAMSGGSPAETPEASTMESPAMGDTGQQAAGSTADLAQPDMRQQHDESVARILKEFDDLREAARAEMDAMRNLMQQERELQDAMAPPPPPRYPPAWGAPGAGYNPYGQPPRYPY